MGVSLPFDGPAGPFNSTFSTADQIKSNLINLLLTNKGERLYNPEFGANLKTVLFDGITDDLTPIIQNLIHSNVNIFVPEVEIVDILVNSDRNTNSVSVTINYRLIISGTSQQITVQFI